MGRPGLTEHRKFRRLARSLGSPMLARGGLELLWDSCYEAGEDYVGTADDIESLVGWSGEPGFLTRALVLAGAPEGAGFIEPVSSGDDAGPTRYRVHDLFHHAPEYVSNRRAREMERRRPKACSHCGQAYFSSDPRALYCSSSCRKGGWRIRQNAGIEEGNGLEQSDASRETDRNGTPAPAPAPAPAPVSVKNVSSEALARSAPAEPPVLVFPTVGSEKTWGLSAVQLEEWRALFPGLSVSAECRKALAWLHANPLKRKTSRGMARFLVGWLTRATDKPYGDGESEGLSSRKTMGNVAAAARFAARTSE